MSPSAACGLLGLAARYVSGYLETAPPPGKPKLVGADASHAWISLFVPDAGWVDLDPTNNRVAGRKPYHPGLGQGLRRRHPRERGGHGWRSAHARRDGGCRGTSIDSGMGCPGLWEPPLEVASTYLPGATHDGIRANTPACY
jgi:transglutaminase-like putative cysteine protease